MTHLTAPISEMWDRRRSRTGIAGLVWRTALMMLNVAGLFLLTGCQLGGYRHPAASAGISLPPSAATAAVAARTTPAPAAAAALSSAIRSYHAGRPIEALNSISQARQLDPGPATAIPALELTARIRFDEADRELGVAALEELALAAGHNADLLNRCGTQLMQAGATAEALPPLQRAVALAPRQPQFARDLAAALVQSGESARALDVLEQAARRSPDSAELTAAMGLIAEQLHRWNDAASCYRRAVSQGLNSESWQRRLAAALYQTEQYAEAAKVYRPLLGEDFRRGTVEERVRFADAAIRTRQFRVALNTLDNLTTDLPHSHSDLEALRATCTWELGHREQAEGIVAAALRLSPEDEQLVALRSFFLSEPASGDQLADLPQPPPELPRISARTGTTADNPSATGSPVASGTAASSAAAGSTAPPAAMKAPSEVRTASSAAQLTPARPAAVAIPPAAAEPVAQAAVVQPDAGQGSAIELSSWKAVRQSAAKTDINRPGSDSSGLSENSSSSASWKPRPRWNPAGSSASTEVPAESAEDSEWSTPRQTAPRHR